MPSRPSSTSIGNTTPTQITTTAARRAPPAGRSAARARQRRRVCMDRQWRQLTQANVSAGDADGLAPSGAAQLTFDVVGATTCCSASPTTTIPRRRSTSRSAACFARVSRPTAQRHAEHRDHHLFQRCIRNAVHRRRIGRRHHRLGSRTASPSTCYYRRWSAILSSAIPPAGGLLTPSTDDIFIDTVSALRIVRPGCRRQLHDDLSPENGAGVSIGSTATDVRDLDSTNMSATIVPTNAQAGDVLTVGTLPSGITGSVDTTVAGQVTVTLTGSPPRRVGAGAIAITFSNTGDGLEHDAARRHAAAVNDGGLSSAVATSTISVVAVNDAPVEQPRRPAGRRTRYRSAWR